MWLFGLPGGRVIVGLIAIGTLGVREKPDRKGVLKDFLNLMGFEHLCVEGGVCKIEFHECLNKRSTRGRLWKGWNR